MKKYSHLFFDLDGTLWDIAANTRAAFDILFEKHAANGLGELNKEDFTNTYMRHNEAVWALYRVGKIEKSELRVVRFQKTFAELKSGADQDFINQFSDEFVETCPRQPHLVEGVRQVLEHCHGKYGMHILTNGFVEIQGLKMRAGDIGGYFENVINSEEAKARKPQREIFQYALSKAGAKKSECLMIGDDWEADIIGARDFGIDQAWLRSGNPGDHYSPTYTLEKMSNLIEIL